jgi:hypothetical protein
MFRFIEKYNYTGLVFEEHTFSSQINNTVKLEGQYYPISLNIDEAVLVTPWHPVITSLMFCVCG